MNRETHSGPSSASASRERAHCVELVVGSERVRFTWGEPHHLGSAAYWVGQTRDRPAVWRYRLGNDLAEEVAVCVLGGHGVRADVGLAAFEHVRTAGLVRLAPPPTCGELETALREPLRVPGRRAGVRYRFPRQRAHRLADALARLATEAPPGDALALRDWLVGLPGIGPKTASWIVRNHLGSNDVAIIDVHVHRAGVAAGFFSPSWRLPRDYAKFEAAFIGVARLGGVPTAALDACVWGQMQALGPAAHLVTGAQTSGR